MPDIVNGGSARMLCVWNCAANSGHNTTGINMIRLSAAGKHFGSKILFEGLDWLITPTDRVGLVGGNGTGKSTLLKILGGMDSLEDGLFSAPKGIATGYLPQDGLSLSGRTV